MKANRKERLRARLAQETQEDPGLWERIEARLPYPYRASEPVAALPSRGRRAVTQALKAAAAAAAVMALVLGAVWMSPRPGGSLPPEDSGGPSSALPAAEDVPFESTLFKYGLLYRDGIAYPQVRRVDSPQELSAFRKACEPPDDLIGGESHDGDFAPYTAAFFKTHTLLLVLIEEPSGSISHQVTGLRRVGDTLTVLYARYCPFMRTADMAYWLACVEVAREDAAGASRCIAQVDDGETAPELVAQYCGRALYAEAAASPIQVYRTLAEAEAYYLKERPDGNNSRAAVWQTSSAAYKTEAFYEEKVLLVVQLPYTSAQDVEFLRLFRQGRHVTARLRTTIGQEWLSGQWSLFLAVPKDAIREDDVYHVAFAEETGPAASS